MVDFPVLKAFFIDLATTVITLTLAWVAMPDNLSKAGVSSFIAPVAAALAGSALVAWRRFIITKKEEDSNPF